MKTEIENAKIVSTELAIVNGALVGWIHLKFDCGGVGFGGRVLSTESTDMSNGFGAQWIHQIIKTVGVNSWEELVGSYVRIMHTGWGGKVIKIGNILEDNWFSQDELAEEIMEKVAYD